MEFKIKQEPNLKCDYTGETTTVLVQLVDAKGQASSWMSATALKNALNVLAALAPVPQTAGTLHGGYKPRMIEVLPLEEEAEEEEAPEVAPQLAPFLEDKTPRKPLATRTKAKPSGADQRVLEALREDCIELVQDPPADLKGQQSGVHESHIRTLIGRYK